MNENNATSYTKRLRDLILNIYLKCSQWKGCPELLWIPEETPGREYLLQNYAAMEFCQKESCLLLIKGYRDEEIEAKFNYFPSPK